VNAQPKNYDARTSDSRVSCALRYCTWIGKRSCDAQNCRGLYTQYSVTRIVTNADGAHKFSKTIKK